jgi:LysM repeat protein
MFRQALVILVVGVAVIVTGAVRIATHSTGSSSAAAPAAVLSAPTSPTSASPAPSPPPSQQTVPVSKHDGQKAKPKAQRVEPGRAKREATKPAITYTVKPGDNLTVIAAWFHLHGYGALYQWNKQVIGSNPNLIYPGQRITVSAAGNTMTS